MAFESSGLRVRPMDRQTRMAWRNGGGETRELCAWPDAAGLDDFAWRASVATVARSGPFSRYPGVIRTAVLIDGTGFRLVAADARLDLCARFAQATFTGDAAWRCDLMEGPVQVFNVMVRAAHAARVQVVSGAPARVAAAPHRVVYMAHGSGAVRVDARVVQLAPGDACAVDDAGCELEALPAATACILVASMSAASAG